MPHNNDIELRSEEVQEVMNRIPLTILRWGTTVVALIIAIFIAIGYLVEVPVTEDFTFTMDTNESKNIIYLSPSALQFLQSNDTTEVLLHSDIFPDEYSSGIPIVITVNQISLNSTGIYEATFKIPTEIEPHLSKRHLTISGKATIIVSHKTILDSFKLFQLKVNRR